MKYYQTRIMCNCGNWLDVTHITRGYIFECIMCSRVHWKGFRAFLGRLFGEHLYMFLITGRWPRYI